MYTLADRTDAVSPSDRTRPSWQGRALVIGGALFIVGNVLHPLQHDDAAYQAATWEAAHLTILFSLPFLVLGLPALHRRLVGRIGHRMALVPVVASMVGLIGIAPGCVVEAFVAPRIGHAAMQELTSGGMGLVDAVFGIAYLGGTIALGMAVRRAGIGPRWIGTALTIDAVVLLLCMGLTGPVGGVIVITATVVYGSALAILGARS